MMQNKDFFYETECFSLLREAPVSFHIDDKKLAEIARDVLGENYTVSVVVCTAERSQELNRTYRQKDKPTNVLSFPLTEKEGELFLCPDVIEQEASLFERTPASFFEFLFIHGIFHLKGLDHGSKMEKEEQKIRLKYNV